MAFKMKGWSPFTQVDDYIDHEATARNLAKEKAEEKKEKKKVSKNIVYRDYPRKSDAGIYPSGTESEEYVYSDDPRHPDYQRLDDLGLE